MTPLTLTSQILDMFKAFFSYFCSTIFLVAIIIITIKICAIEIHFRKLRGDVAILKTLKDDLGSGMFDIVKKNYEKLASLLVTYSANTSKESLELVRHGKDGDGGYVVPVKAFKEADVLLGYGIAGDSSFEDQFSEIYDKPSYGFDCGVESVDSKSSKFTFVNQCIGTDETLNDTKSSSHNIASFSQQLDNLNLRNKKIFIKMDIERAEYQVFEDILQYASQITGIVMELHVISEIDVHKAVRLLSNLNKDFILVHVHGNDCSTRFFATNNSEGAIPRLLELTYINKSLVSGYNISTDQKHPTNLDISNCPANVNEFTILLNR